MATTSSTAAARAFPSPQGTKGFFLIDESGNLAGIIGFTSLDRARQLQREHGLMLAFSWDGIVARYVSDKPLSDMSHNELIAAGFTQIGPFEYCRFS